MSGTQSYLGRYIRKPIDVETEKREGWCRHGVLVVREDDQRLTWLERELIKQLGARLYGRRMTIGGGHG